MRPSPSGNTVGPLFPRCRGSACVVMAESLSDAVTACHFPDGLLEKRSPRIPDAGARKTMRSTSRALAAALPLLLASAAARAQSEPKFDFGKQEEVKQVEWKAQAKGGYLLTTGNSQSQNGTFSLSASRKEGGNKLALEGGIAYGRSNIRVPVLDPNVMAPNPPSIVALDRQEVTTTNNWFAKGRYDRFFTANNSGYA